MWSGDDARNEREVRRVDEELSECRVIEEVDPLTNPITAGDFVSSPFYDKAEQPVLVFAGTGFTSKDLTTDYLRTKLGSYGVRVSEAVDTDTTFIVALQNYRETDEYRTAQDFRVPVLRERDLLEFIGD